MNKRKIINDPVYGFVTIPGNLIFDIIEHRYFQRLRRIRQLGLTDLVYPGALHTRFHHALGAMHLAGQASDVLKSKGIAISDDEREALQIAILLHDIGHGPFSHTLEKCLVPGLSHERLSIIFMQKLNDEFEMKLSMALQIFQNNYPRKFFHNLIAGQLDMDRMDYLNRDSFFTGVYEGVIGYDRIIKMLMVKNDKLVVESKGIYSIEKFLIARRLMYWQVYLHKTVLCAEQMLIRILKRARLITQSGGALFSYEPLKFFLENTVKPEDFNQATVLDAFAGLDDYDIWAHLKMWCKAEDKTLATLCQYLVNRKLLNIEITNEAPPPEHIKKLTELSANYLNISFEDAQNFVFSDRTSNSAYNPDEGKIEILFKDGSLSDVAEASDQLNISVLSKAVTKFYLCYPKGLNL